MLQLRIVWGQAPARVRVEVLDGKLASLRGSRKTKVRGNGAQLPAGTPQELQVGLDQAQLGLTAPATRVTVTTSRPEGGFTFFVRDVAENHPIFLPEQSAAVLPGNDRRDYQAVVANVQALGLVHPGQQINLEPEESFDTAAARTVPVTCETWLGLSRDIRIFCLATGTRHYNTLTIKPRHHGTQLTLPENDNAPTEYTLQLGRGCGGEYEMNRRLDQGVLPILHFDHRDGQMHYQSTALVTTLPKGPTAGNLRGTDFLVADGYGAGHMFTPEQQKCFDERKDGETVGRKDQTVLLIRTVMVNTGAAPAYAFLSSIALAAWRTKTQVDGGLLSFEQSGRVFSTARLNGKPMPQREASVLLRPGESAVLELAMPHQPVSRTAARELLKIDFAEHLAACRAFWQAKLKTGAAIHLPDVRIDEMIRAGLLHLDVVAYGKEKKGPVAATIGVYCPIGSESAPIIQFFDSMGWHDVARRSLQYFLDKQRDDGMFQNFGGYMLETGPALWSMGEHYRYTRDLRWVRQIRPQILKACDFLIRWRERNLRPDLRGKGYGLIEGKVADPEDHFRQFMLNGYAVQGLSRVAEMLAKVDPAQSRRLGKEAAAWRLDIRAALAQSMRESPVVPVGDGSWQQTAPPWAEMRGPSALYVDGTPCFTHGTFCGRDSMLGPHYLLLQEVLEPNEPMTTALLRSHQALFLINNVAFSQPYYSRHECFHLLRGEVKEYLKTYFGTVAGLADRQTYTFWEHYFGASPHKTHEEGWFLMQTRWMLYLERGSALQLLPMVPRAYLADGKTIELDDVASYFGKVQLKVQSQVKRGQITAQVRCPGAYKPKEVLLRLPHPDGLYAKSCSGGRYDPASETVRIAPFSGSAGVTLSF